MDEDSAAAREYAFIAPGTTRVTIFVDCDHALDTAFEERDILKLDE